MDWVFDLDNTLYRPHKHIWLLTFREMTHYFKETLNLPVNLTPEEREQLKKKWDTVHTLVAYTKEFHLDFDKAVEMTLLSILDEINVELRPGTDIIKNLPGNHYVLTNSPEVFAIALLKKLGLLGAFDGVYGIRKDTLITKPHSEIYARVPVGKHVVMIDDTSENLVVPHKLGWTTCWFPIEAQPTDAPMPSHTHHRIHSLANLQDIHIRSS